MNGGFSIRRRLAAGLALGVTFLWIVATGLATLSIASELDEVFDGMLEETAQRVLPLAVADIIDREEEGRQITVSDLRGGEEVLTYVVRDSAGRVLLKSHDADVAAFPRFEGVGFQNHDGKRFFFDAAMQETLTIAVAEPLAHRREAVLHAAGTLLWPLLFLVPLSVAGVWMLVRRGLEPVDAFSAAIESRGAGDLKALDTRGLPVEMVPLGQEVNRLLERLRLTLEAERSFAANSAHELRTPVAAALAQTQRLIAEAPDDATRGRAGEIESALRRLTALAEKLMQLAKSEGGALVAAEPADVRPVLDLVVADFLRDPHDAGRLRWSPPDSAVLSTLDADALAILARNLIENALRHGTPGTPVEVTLAPASRLSVTNDCAPLDPPTLARIRRPLERGDGAGEGSGLGLAIAAAITRGAGLSLVLVSPLAGTNRGFKATVHLA